MSGKTLAVFRKEILDTLRDGRSVFAIFVMPFLLYPALISFMSWMEAKNDEEASALTVRVGLVGGAQIPEAGGRLAAVPGVKLVPLEAAPARLEDAGVDAALVIPDGIRAGIARGDSVKVELLYKQSENKSSAALRRVRPVLGRAPGAHGGGARWAPTRTARRRSPSRIRRLLRARQGALFRGAPDPVPPGSYGHGRRHADLGRRDHGEKGEHPGDAAFHLGLAD
jgi:hypothetical protein